MKGAPRLPVIFVGHGNPMNAVGDSPFTRSLGELGKRIPTPTAILCISAHWEKPGIWVTHMPYPKTIHDFRGFPPKLFEIQYPAPGSPELAEQVAMQIPQAQFDEKDWGLDHGSWSVLIHMFPKANIPVVQISIDTRQSAKYHFNLGRQLLPLREQGVLILGSGNIVHNLGTLKSENSLPYDWAIEFDEWVKQKLISQEYEALRAGITQSSAGKLSIPTPEHWIPLFYTLGASQKEDKLSFIYEGFEHGSISMRSFILK